VGRLARLYLSLEEGGSAVLMAVAVVAAVLSAEPEMVRRGGEICMRTTGEDGKVQEECREERLSTDAPLVMEIDGVEVRPPVSQAFMVEKMTAATTKRIFGFPLFFGGLASATTMGAYFALMKQAGAEHAASTVATAIVTSLLASVVGVGLLSSANSDLEEIR
jgi:hypothetical protein